MNLPHLPHLPRRHAGTHLGWPHLRLLKTYSPWNFSLSIKLILLVIIPLALTLGVTVPLTMTGLNKLASVTSAERLEDEILLVDKHLKLFEFELGRSIEEIAVDPNLIAAVQGSDTETIREILLSSHSRFGLQHLEIVGLEGDRVAHEHRGGDSIGQESLNHLIESRFSGNKNTEMVLTADGWFLTSARQLVGPNGPVGNVSVGKLLDARALSEMNFDRSDPVLILLDDDARVVAASLPDLGSSEEIPVVTDPEHIEAAKSGLTTIGSTRIGGKKLPTAYVSVGLGSGSRSVFAVVLTESLVVDLRDELIANDIIVISALCLLVLGVGYTVTRSISRRILRLRDGAVEIGSGNLSFRIEETAQNEMGTLAREFNWMSDRLDEKNNQLEAANHDLERRVSERTEELEQANAQLVEAQSQLVRTEKFGALGELSTGVAHDLRNPLGAIRNGILYLQSRLAKSERLTEEPRFGEYLQIMDERIAQCDKIIHDVISFTRISSPDYEVVNLEDVLDSSLSGVEIPEGITFINAYRNGETNVHVDPGQLQRVFTNLLVNAYEAMADGGELTIAVKTSGQFAEVAFSDTGLGMNAGGLEKIFEPLFTTKIQGTGLGLSVCQQVLAKHNGRMDVHSKEEAGTTFTVRLPLTSEAAQPQAPPGSASGD